MGGCGIRSVFRLFGMLINGYHKMCGSLRTDKPEESSVPVPIIGITALHGWTKRRLQSAASATMTEMVDGGRIFDLNPSSSVSDKRRGDWQPAQENSVFTGPSGRFFSDGKWLYSAITLPSYAM